MNQAIARINSRRRDLSLPNQNDDIQLLDPRAGELRPAGPRVDTIATISLGYKAQVGGRPIPKPTRKADSKWLHPHDAEDAPALIRALEAGKHRTLTVSLASDNWSECVQQHYACYSQTALQVYGDADQLTYITKQPVLDKDGEPVLDEKKRPRTEPMHYTVFKADDPEKYARMLKVVKVQTSIYFYLAEWRQEGNAWVPMVVMDGDTGLYRFRTTSEHTVQNLASTFKQIRAITGGHIKGVPLTLGVNFPTVSGPDGTKREIPTCYFRLQPPYEITDVNFRPMLEAAVETGQRLALAAPRMETLEAEQECAPLMPEIVGDSREIDLIARGGRCAAGRYTRIFFAMVKGTNLEGDEARAELMRTYTSDRTDSLAEFLKWSTDEDAEKFIAWVDREMNGDDVESEPEDQPFASDDYERPAGSGDTPNAGHFASKPSIRQSSPRVFVDAQGDEIRTDTGEIVTEDADHAPDTDDMDVLLGFETAAAEPAIDTDEARLAAVDAAADREANELLGRTALSDAPILECLHQACLDREGPPLKAVPGSDPPRCPDHLALDQAGEASA